MPPTSTTPPQITRRLAAALASEHTAGPLALLLADRVVDCLAADPAALTRLTEAVEALRPTTLARSLTAERFGSGVSRG